MPNALSRISHCQTISVVQAEDWLKIILQHQQKDEEVVALMDQCRLHGGTYGNFCLHNNVLFLQDKVFVPNNMDLRLQLLRKAHDCKLWGNPRQNVTVIT